MNNKLKKIVNEIKYSEESITKYLFDYKEEKLKERVIRTEMVDYFTEVERKRLLLEKEHKDIDLQDLFLVLNKKTPFKIVSNPIYNGLIELAFIELGENGYKVNETLILDISQPLSNQKPEVYNKLIEILK